ncbi:Hypothetical predicted protein [Olea europaea subsp. europaea]|uniref:Uncharacterized protein n=1 Tax=Olea europaea subsp. europaea TaxID=158383 RepID=A0A8S0UUJ2_OLEEU|nr:Hypothetical predicted protein [Olea europaea subsp. europaea]
MKLLLVQRMIQAYEFAELPYTLRGNQKEDRNENSNTWARGHYECRGRRAVDNTAILRAKPLLIHVRAVRRKGCVTASSPSPHGGRGALPSEGGSPSDLLFLAGGGIYC